VPPLVTLAWCALAGVFGAVGLVALYRALAAGSMGLAAPVSGVLSAAVPVAVAFFIEGPPSVRQTIGFGVALAAVWLVSATAERGRAGHLALAILAGLGFGLFIAIIGRVGTTSVFTSIVAARTGSLVAILAAAAAGRQPWRPRLEAIVPIAVAGLCDAGGNVFLVSASRLGRPDVAAVLSSLYAGATVLLAWLVLREHLGPPRLAGLALALLAIVLITAG
jgi:drug/metabolite transporter (DMT)-like permease